MAYRLVQAYRPKFVKHLTSAPLLEIDREIWHTCPMNPRRSVPRFLFLPDFFFFVFCEILGLRSSKKTCGEKKHKKSIRQRLGRDS